MQGNAHVDVDEQKMPANRNQMFISTTTSFSKVTYLNHHIGSIVNPCIMDKKVVRQFALASPSVAKFILVINGKQPIKNAGCRVEIGNLHAL